MDTVANAEPKTTSVSNNQAHASHLISAFNQHVSQISVLSLDCFDTILWRKTATPADVFHDLHKRPTFKALDYHSFLRTQSESNARLKKLLTTGSNEVQLRDIYLAAFPNLTEEQITALEEEELAAEIDACYPHPSVVELIRTAHAAGLKIIIVSDTYLKYQHLEQLLKSTLPADVFAAIDKIFPSNEYGRSKPQGLFEFVLKDLKLSPRSILHVGDNYVADCMAAEHVKIKALHFIHHDDGVTELLRMQGSALGLMDQSVRKERGLTSPFRGVLAAAKLAYDKPEELIGYASIGQIMYSFANFIIEEVKSLKQQGKNPKVLFLMRDAYLPELVCDALTEQPIGKSVRISRFSSFASSFRTQKDVDHYLGDALVSNRFNEMAKQLLLPEAVRAPIVRSAENAEDPAAKFLQQIHQKQILDIIFKNSAKYRQRLIRHLENEVGMQKGDTLVLVDLGYSGTTQQLLEPIFREELGVEMTGRYLIALGVPNWQTTRRGLLDPSWCDERTMRSLVAYIALLEQICTSSEKSVLDYEENGTPIFSETGLSKNQHNKLEPIHKQCVNFAKDAKKFFASINKQFPMSLFRDAALGEITRLLYLPSATEVNYFQSLEFELNMGTKDIFRVFDQDKGLSSLRKRGMFFTSMERTLKSIRMNYPAELRSAGLELGISLLAHNRYGLAFNINDASLRREQLNVIIINKQQQGQVTLTALHTHDGYYALVIPVGNGNIQAGILFGQRYQWIQLDSAEIIPTNAYLGAQEPHYAENCWTSIHFNQMNDRGDKLFECESNTSLMIVAPKINDNSQNYVVRIVFRPITARDSL